MTRRLPCCCPGYDPADPCRHNDTSAGCPKHDPQAAADYLAELEDELDRREAGR